MPPDLFQQHIGTLPDETDAYIAAPSEATHRPEQGTHSTIDYFFLRGALKDHIADVAVDLAYGVSPHRAVRITLWTIKQKLLVEKTKKPKSFPRQKPIGPPRAPVILEWVGTPTVDVRAATRHFGVEGSWPILRRAVECEMRRV